MQRNNSNKKIQENEKEQAKRKNNNHQQLESQLIIALSLLAYPLLLSTVWVQVAPFIICAIVALVCVRFNKFM